MIECVNVSINIGITAFRAGVGRVTFVFAVGSGYGFGVSAVCRHGVSVGVACAVTAGLCVRSVAVCFPIAVYVVECGVFFLSDPNITAVIACICGVTVFGAGRRGVNGFGIRTVARFGESAVRAASCMGLCIINGSPCAKIMSKHICGGIGRRNFLIARVVLKYFAACVAGVIFNVADCSACCVNGFGLFHVVTECVTACKCCFVCRALA